MDTILNCQHGRPRHWQPAMFYLLFLLCTLILWRINMTRIVMIVGTAAWFPVGRENDAEWYFWRTRCGGHAGGTSFTVERSSPYSTSRDGCTPLDSVQWLVHDSAARHTVLVVRRPRRTTEPHHARRPASRQSTHGATQCSRGRPTSWWVDRYSAESGQWQSKPSTLRSSDSAYNSRKARCKKFTGNEWSWDGAHDDHTTHECSRTWQSSRFTDTRHHQCVLTADHTPTPTAEMLVMETQTPLNLMSNLITSSVNRKQRREIRFLLYFSQVTMLSVSKCRSLLKNESVLEMGR